MTGQADPFALRFPFVFDAFTFSCSNRLTGDDDRGSGRLPETSTLPRFRLEVKVTVLVCLPVLHRPYLVFTQ